MTLLDTHALVWVLEDAPRLGTRAARRANQALANDTLWTSVVVFWEVSLLVTRGRLALATSPEQFRTRVLGFGIRELAITGEIALRAASILPRLKDPADCFVAATAAVHHATLMTADARLLDAGIADVIDARR